MCDENDGRSRKRRWNEQRPDKPKRPAAKFGNYLAHFAAEMQTTSLRGPDLMREAASSWNKLNDFEKDLYKNDDELEIYLDELKDYRTVCAAMKRPPESYALFVQHYWKTQHPKFDGSKEDFARVSRRISQEWANTPDETKAAFKAVTEAAKVIFRQEQDAVLTGHRNLNINWRQQGFEQVCNILQRRGRPRPGPSSSDPSGQDDVDQFEDISKILKKK